MAPQSYQMVMRSGPTPGKTFELNKSEITIGRDIVNDIVINDAEVSRKHARLVSQAGSYVLEDVGSTNGTFVNGQRLMGPHLLRPGELILFGENVSLSYEYTQFDPDATMVAASNVPGMPPAPTPPSSRETFVPASQQPPPPPRPVPPPPRYEDQYTPSTAEVYPMAEEEPRERRTWLYVGCGCLAVVLCLLVVAGVAFDQLNLYCTPPFDAFFACP